MIKFFATLFFIVGILVYSYGFHNVDISFNMRDTQIDIAPSGIQRSKPELYSLGLQGLIVGVIFLILGFSLLLWQSYHQQLNSL